MAHTLIVGAGPAGACLAHLLAHRGIDVTLLERQSDFAREFRGEVLMPSGIDVIEQLGLGAALASVPAYRAEEIELFMNRRSVLRASVDPAFFEGRIPLALSQPALLELLVSEAGRSGRLRFLRGAGVRDLLHEDGRVVGVRAQTQEGPVELRADLVVGADGRASMVRKRGAFEARDRDVPMDIVWCKLPCPDWLRGARAYIGRGHLLIAYHTWDDDMQVAWVILKGTYGELKRRGIEQWVGDMADHVSPDLAEHIRTHGASIRHPFLLDTVSDCVLRWSAPGALLIGDASHTMSPVGGQGLNIALRDAVVAANHLVPALAGERSDPARVDAATRAVEAERAPEVDRIQRLQAIPPRVVLSRAWWGEPVRRLAMAFLRTGLGQTSGLATARGFLFGREDVKLRV